MRISIFGSGYVGLVQAAIFADVGHSVICMDVDADRIERLRQGYNHQFFYKYALLRLLKIETLSIYC